jgi:hypothetical protein
MSELSRITQNYALGTEDLFRDYFGDSGTTSHYVSEPAIPYQHPEYQEERMDPDRIALAVREGAGKIPGDIAELAELIRPVLQYAPGGAPLRTAPVKRFMEDLPESADRYWMSNPNYFDESRSVKPLSFDENVAGWGTRIAADPLNIVAGAIPKSGILATKVMMPKFSPMKQVATKGLIDPARRKFMQDTAVTAGVTGLGGIAGLNMMTKGTPEAAAMASDIATKAVAGKPVSSAGWKALFPALKKFLTATDDELASAHNAHVLKKEGWEWSYDASEVAATSAENLNLARKTKNEAIEELGGVDVNKLLKKLKKNPKAKKEFDELLDYPDLNLEDQLKNKEVYESIIRNARKRLRNDPDLDALTFRENPYLHKD